MSVKIRLKRIGRKKRPYYRLVVSDSRAQRDGTTIEEIGQYDPSKNLITLSVDNSRIKYWLDNGAKPSDTARTLLKKQGFYKWYHEEKLSKSSTGETKEKGKKIEVIETEGKKITIEKFEKKSAKEKKRERAKTAKKSEAVAPSAPAAPSAESVPETVVTPEPPAEATGSTGAEEKSTE